MLDARRRHVPAFPARKLRAHAEIEVLEIAEEVLVESAHAIEHRFPQRARATVGRQHFLGTIVLAEIFLLPAA